MSKWLTWMFVQRMIIGTPAFCYNAAVPARGVATHFWLGGRISAVSFWSDQWNDMCFMALIISTELASVRSNIATTIEKL